MHALSVYATNCRSLGHTFHIPDTLPKQSGIQVDVVVTLEQPTSALVRTLTKAPVLSAISLLVLGLVLVAVSLGVLCFVAFWGWAIPTA